MLHIKESIQAHKIKLEREADYYEAVGYRKLQINHWIIFFP